MFLKVTQNSEMDVEDPLACGESQKKPKRRFFSEGCGLRLQGTYGLFFLCLGFVDWKRSNHATTREVTPGCVDACSRDVKLCFGTMAQGIKHVAFRWLCVWIRGASS